jgi:uncharacterized protein YkwD/uncharacterized membrane protein required for colicin V production
VILVDLVLIALLAFAAYMGTRRGAILVGLELISFLVATVVAFMAYHPAGSVITHLAGTPTALSNVAGFLVAWITAELLCAITLRFTVIKHLEPRLKLTQATKIGGGVLNSIKFAVIAALAATIFAGLPLDSGTKRFVTEAAIPKLMLASTGRLQSVLSTGLGRDLGESLNFFTVTAEPESEQRIELGYTTKGTIDAQSEDAMLVLVNHERTTRGLKPLTMNDKARQVARAYSADMFARGYFSHLDPDGKSPFDRMRAGDVEFGTAGENLALAPTLKLAHQGLMNSPGHRANILKPEYRTVGIGIVDGGAYGLMVTQDFTD